jgi:ligand-binding SRPBCC domain-containing protein
MQFEQWVPFPLEHVFLFFANPENLPRIMPPWMNVRLERLNIVPPPAAAQAAPENANFAGAGSELEASFCAISFLPFRLRSTAIITAFVESSYFEDIQGKGPFKSWHHRHEFAAEERDGVNGTILRDIVHYEVGYGWAGKLANALFIAPQMRRTFAHRQEALQKLL